MPWYFSCKSHWFCGLVQIHPQNVVVFILNTATESGWLSPWDPPLPWGKVHEEFTAPQHTRFILPLFHPTKSSLRCVGGIFLYGKRTLKISWAVRTWYRLSSQRRCTNRGRNFVRSKRWFPLHEQRPATYFLHLNNSETITRKRFWAQR